MMMMMLMSQEQTPPPPTDIPPLPECSALCGRRATGKLHVKVRLKRTDAEATPMPLPLCDSCRERIDPRHEWIFVPFHFNSHIGHNS
jgi:hypothetical protein